MGSIKKPTACGTVLCYFAKATLIINKGGGMVRIAKVFKMKALGLAVLAFGLSLAFITTPVAHAQASPADKAVQVCNGQAPGSGYYVQRSHGLNGARVYQLY